MSKLQKYMSFRQCPYNDNVVEVRFDLAAAHTAGDIRRRPMAGVNVETPTTIDRVGDKWTLLRLDDVTVDEFDTLDAAKAAALEDASEAVL